MEEKDKQEIINNSNKTIDKVSDTLKVDGSKAKEHISKLNDSDLKFLRELEDIVKMFKKHKLFWKCILGIIVVSSFLNILYQVGYWIGQLLYHLGL